MDNNNQQYIQDDEITLKELILLVQKYFQECLRNWWLIVGLAFLFSSLFVVRAYLGETKYTAKVTYTTNSGSGLSGAAGLLGRFVGGGRSGDPIMKMQGMLESQQIMERVLLRKVTIDGENDYLINHHARIYEYEKQMEDSENKYVKQTKPKFTTRQENKIFLRVHREIVENLLSQGVNEDNGIANLGITSKSEEYAYELSQVIFAELEKFFIESELGEQQKTLAALENRADSVYAEIQKLTYSVANLQDTDKGRVFMRDRVPELKAQTELGFLKTVYQEVIKNVETIKFTLASSTPTIRAIDMPLLPLKGSNKGLIKQLIIGGFFGGFLSVLFVVGRKIFREIMSDEEE